MITRLFLKNWMSYNEIVIDLRPGFNLFYGENGAGKSAILNAIQFALSGKLIYKTIRTNLIKVDQSEAIIHLDIENPQKNREIYQIRRTVNRENKVTAALFQLPSNRQIKSGIQAVNKFLDELFENTEKFVRDLFLFREGEIHSFLATSRSVREHEYYKYTRLDRIDEIINLTNEKLKTQNSLFKERKSNFEKIKSLSEEFSRDDLQSQLSEVETHSQSLSQQILELEDYYNLRESEYHELLRRQKKKEDLISNRDKLAERVNELSYEIGKYFDDKIISQVYNDSIELLGKKYDEVKSELENNQIEIVDKKSKMSFIKSQLELLNSSITLGSNSCPICLQPITSHQIEDVNKHFNQQLNNFQVNIAELNREQKIILNSLNILHDFIKIKRDLTETKIKLDLLVNEVKVFDKDSKTSLDRNLLRECKEKLETMKEEFGAVTNERKNLKLRIEDLKHRKKIEFDLKTEIHNTMAGIENLTVFKDACSYISSNFFAVFFKEIQEEVTKLLSDTFDLHFGEFSIDKESLFPVFGPNDQRVSFENLSAGEKVLVFIALRLAILNHFSHTPIIIIDEPSEFLDGSNSIFLRKHILQLIQRNPNFGQVIIAANDPRFTGPLSEDFDFPWGKVYLVFKTAEGSQVKEIVKKREPIEKNTSYNIFGYMSQSKLKELLRIRSVNFIEVSASDAFPFDLIVTLKGEKFAIQVKQTIEHIESQAFNPKNYILELKKVIEQGYQGMILTFATDKKWFGVLIPTKYYPDFNLSEEITPQPLEKILTS